MPDTISVVSRAALQGVAGPLCNPDLTLVASGRPVPGDLHFEAAGFTDGQPHGRVLASIDYLTHLHGIAAQDADPDTTFRFVFQGEDVPANMPSVSWETKTSWNDITLVPDLYYYHARGYEHAVLDDVAWGEREATVFWRGSTTGLYYQRIEDLDLLPRYRLCRIVSALGAVGDVGLNAVVQPADAEQERLIHDRIAAEGLLKPYVPMTEMVRYRYILDIDGNSNSWGLMMKLRLGCCVLRVDSDWRQWFAPRLKPWVHYVPVAKDLSNAAERIAWCLDNPDESAAIAARGAAFARGMRFDNEMAAAATRLFRAPPGG